MRTMLEQTNTCPSSSSFSFSRLKLSNVIVMITEFAVYLVNQGVHYVVLFKDFRIKNYPLENVMVIINCPRIVLA